MASEIDLRGVPLQREDLERAADIVLAQPYAQPSHVGVSAAGSALWETIQAEIDSHRAYTRRMIDIALPEELAEAVKQDLELDDGNP
jgi:hypothetical protein